MRHSQIGKQKLGWAAALHEVGNAISCSYYHKHGAYILENTDMMGFNLPELSRLGLLVLGHRGKLKKLDVDFETTLSMFTKKSLFWSAQPNRHQPRCTLQRCL